MARETVTTGVRVYIDIELASPYRGVQPKSIERANAEADAMLKDIKHHLGRDHDVSGFASENLQVEHCQHCKRDWTEDGRLYNGGCCDADQAEEDAREAERNRPSMPQQILNERDGTDA